MSSFFSFSENNVNFAQSPNETSLYNIQTEEVQVRAVANNVSYLSFFKQAE